MKKIEPTPSFFIDQCVSNMVYSWYFGSKGSEYHRHMDFYEFCLVVSDKYKHIYNGVETELNLGDFLFFRPGEAHTLIADSTISFHYSIIIQETYFRKYLEKHMDNNEHVFATPFVHKKLLGPEFAFMTHLASAVARDVTPIHIPYVEHFLYNAIFTLFQPISENYNNSITISAVDLRKNFDSYLMLDWHVQSIYDAYPISRTTLIQDFKRLTGYTIVQYRNIKRIEYAALLLQTENYSITIIANLVHMPNLGYFSSQFQKQYGMTPKQYQLLHQKNSER